MLPSRFLHMLQANNKIQVLEFSLGGFFAVFNVFIKLQASRICSQKPVYLLYLKIESFRNKGIFQTDLSQKKLFYY